MSVDFKICLKKLVKPIVSFCLRRGLSYQDFADISKTAFVEQAQNEIAKKGQKINSSRISAMTGIRRPEIKRIKEGSEIINTPSLVSRVVSQWENDSNFKTKAGKPKILGFGKDNSEFNELVLSVSTDLHPSTVLFELERLELIEKKPRGIELKEKRHIVTDDIDLGYKILSDDISDLTTSVEQNLFDAPKLKNLHGKTNFDNIYHEDLEEIKQWLLSEGAKLHHKARNFLANFDKDLNPDACKTPGASVTLTTFSKIEEKIGEK